MNRTPSKVPAGWTGPDCAKVVARLESLSHEELVKLCEQLHLHFPDSPLTSIDSHYLISILIADFDSNELMTALGL
jgi:hypothetical protein